MSMENVSLIQIFATVCFALAIIHTFSVKFFHKIGSRFKSGSVGENIFHFLGEVEVVFGLWAAIFITLYSFTDSYTAAVNYLESCRFTEPILVFVLMSICATRPILQLANQLINFVSRLIPLKNKAMKFYIATIILGPILGSFITEPAAMTVTALVLLEKFYQQGMSQKFKYATLGLLFVNVSIGGVFTHYAAPPVLMVATKWGWGMGHMVQHFGWKAFLAMSISTAIVVFRYKSEFSKINFSNEDKVKDTTPVWLKGIHILFLALVIMNHHHAVLIIALFLFFLGIVEVTREYQPALNLKSPMLVAFFLAGLVVLGGMQSWWLESLLKSLDAFMLYTGATMLTAVTDNAAITFLGSQVEGLSDLSKYSMVAGAVVGGGLTVIANAPNPAGYSILNASFGRDGIGAGSLLKGALVPTLVAFMCFWFLK